MKRRPNDLSNLDSSFVWVGIKGGGHPSTPLDHNFSFCYRVKPSEKDLLEPHPPVAYFATEQYFIRNGSHSRDTAI